MPSATSEAFYSRDAVQTFLEKLGDLENVGVNQRHIGFLRDVFEDPSLLYLTNVYDKLEGELPYARDHEAVETARDVLDLCGVQASRNTAAADLRSVMNSAHFKALLSSHDDVCNKRFDDQFDYMLLSEPIPPVFSSTVEQVRFVMVTRRDPSEPLGITVKLDEKDDLIVTRIIDGCLISKQGLLHEYDIVREVNGVSVCTPEQLMEVLSESDKTITFKIGPSYHNKLNMKPVYLRARFNYDPMKDRLLPCKTVGLPFESGAVLEVVNMEDPNWWQARRADGELSDSPAGLIPSTVLEEKRRAFVPQTNDYSKSSLFCGLAKKKKKERKYTCKDAKDLEAADIHCYEEVRRMAPFQRRLLVLAGPHGVGRRSLKERLIRDSPRRFAGVVPYTSRPTREKEVHGQGYFFDSRQKMEEDIVEGRYLEYGEFNGNLYGTRLDTIRDIIDSGKMCVLDVSPSCLAVLKTAEFLPFIVFVAAPSMAALKVMYEEGRRFARGNKERGGVEMKTEDDFIHTIKESAMMERMYNGYFDDILVNDHFEQTYRHLRKMLDGLTSERQWVPVSWVC